MSDDSDNNTIYDVGRGYIGSSPSPEMIEKAMKRAQLASKNFDEKHLDIVQKKKAYYFNFGKDKELFIFSEAVHICETSAFFKVKNIKIVCRQLQYLFARSYRPLSKHLQFLCNDYIKQKGGPTK